ncbi:MAG: aminoacyl-tRNA hydrolase [Syntrophales bacterium]|nr:aminoacyl-tRNA hydrolase [Syntrophales bacterium]MCK9527414.1 aminoacyl-tRNA hydrolase [Syntrophales bacterium]MDX9921516.1 hypothetical protein [Syntrophales bacterium]
MSLSVSYCLSSEVPFSDFDWIVLLPATPQINDVLIGSHTYPGEYYFFGEHDNLGGFIEPGSAFNDDSFIRKEPWHACRPIMRRSLHTASLLDPAYSNNIDCTIKQKAFICPRIGEYSTYGFPVIHDDPGLPFDSIRMKAGGGTAGHKGPASIESNLGTSGFMQVRPGIGKPVDKSRIEGYVLEPSESH